MKNMCVSLLKQSEYWRLEKCIINAQGVTCGRVINSQMCNNHCVCLISVDFKL